MSPGLSAQAMGITPPDDAQLHAQLEQFNAVAPGSILALQPFRAEQVVEAGDDMSLRLVSLNPAVNAWFLLELTPANGRSRFYHLESADPQAWMLSLIGGDDAALVVETANERHLCRPWEGGQSELDTARSSALPYAPVCGQRLYLRNRVSGSRTNREAVVDFLRNNVVFGDSIVEMIKGAFFEDAFMQSADTIEGADAGEVAEALGQANLAQRPVMRVYTGFDLLGSDGGAVEAGSWYAVEGAPGIYASAMQPGMIHPDILNRRGETNALDPVERRADVYLVAFDLTEFELGFEMGTDHPALGWSPRPHGAGRNHRIPGPDGINSPEPLAMVGMLSPALTDRVAATFTAGFKREHGAFRAGTMAVTNHGHHYGFISNGVVLSRLQPGLSTLYALNDGTIDMRVWRDEDAALLPHIRFARQNGVPLIELNPETGEGLPGAQVRHWLPGNWSGSGNAELRTLRAGACMKTVAGRQFLIYAYFSSVTPSGMARSFQAYDCTHAMLLDMNSLEHTYMALYLQGSDGFDTRHLVRGMADIDLRARDGSRIPRFVGSADNRDFFYLLRR